MFSTKCYPADVKFNAGREKTTLSDTVSIPDAAQLISADTVSVPDVARLMDLQKQEYQEERAAFDMYYAQKDEVERMLKTTRKLVRELSKRDPDLQSRLNLSHLSDLRIP